MTTSSQLSISIPVAPVDHRCRYWAKHIDAGTALGLPSTVNGANDIQKPYLQQGEEELTMGDFLIEGEETHHRHPERGWTYRIGYMGIDGALHYVTPTNEHKQALKASGMPVAYLKGAGQLAACLRIIHGLRMGLHADAVPIETSVVPVSMDDYARTAELHQVWFEPSQEARSPTAWQIYQQAAAVARLVSAQGGLEDIPNLDALLSD